jgi:metal-responsive CopG/Arc/MetJ family transcriptional regulator
MKIAVSIPDELFESAETLGRRLRVSRSRLYATALADFLAKHRGRRVTEQLNAVYSKEESRLERNLQRLQRRSLERDAW